MYYPKSQITPNLYTNPGELVTKKTLKSYTGFYYLTSDGKKFAGSYPSDVSVELIKNPELDEESIDSRYTTIELNLNEGDPDPTGLSPAEGQDVNSPNSNPFLEENPNILNQYVSLKSTPNKRKIPLAFSLKPTGQDKRRGYYTRYFSKKTNEAIFIETDYDTFKTFTDQDPNVATDLYKIISLNWILKSEKPINEANKKTVQDIENKLNWHGFLNYFNGNFGPKSRPTRFYYTEGGELVLPNRTSYVGYYHIMEGINRNLMTGRFHGDGAETILFPINSNFTPSFGSPDSSFTPQGNNSFNNAGETTSSPSSGGGGGY